MKKVFSIIALAVFAVCANASTIAYPGLMWSLPSPATNYNVAVGTTGTNSAGVYTNNATTGTVLGASTNTFNLTSGSLFPSTAQANTNLWPSVSWGLNSTYPNTYQEPANNLTLYLNGNITATNASSTTITARFAGSPDGINWVSNYFAFTYIVPINSTNATAGSLTNTTTGGLPFIALQSIENPGVAMFTNVVVSASQKPGI